MIKASSTLLLVLSCLTWLLVGIFLLTFGIHLLLTALSQSHGIDDPFSLLAFLTPKIGSKDNAMIIIISLALFIGYFKGKYVLKKSATKQIKRLRALTPPLTLGHLYTWKYLALISCMMGLGIALRFLPIHIDVRGFIDIAVGAALINGALHYPPALKVYK